MYADAGFDDILYGFPFIPSHFDRVFRLSQVREEKRGGDEAVRGVRSDWSCPAETH